MKRKVISLILLTTMIFTLVGCGGETNTKDTQKNDVIENSQTSNTETQTQNEETQEQEQNSENEIFSEQFTWEFQEDLDGFSNKYVYTEDETWSYNETHYKNEHGVVMDFNWEGPSEIGEEAYESGRTLFLKDASHNYTLRAWCYNNNMSPDQLKAAISYYDKESITMTVEDSDVSYIDNGFYNQVTSDTKGVYTFAVSGEIDGIVYKGYNKYILSVDNHCGYQFSYLEKESIYNDERACKVIDSMTFGIWKLLNGQI